MTNRKQAYDVVVVGARCAGATTASVLARAGRRVLLVDRDEFPSDTVSTHQLFPDALHLLDDLGVTERLRAAHVLRPARYSWRVLGHAVAGSFTPVGDHDRMCSVRRIVLDAALVEAAADSGAELRTGTEVLGVLGAGTAADPVHGVRLATGEEIEAEWVVGADGRSSRVARSLDVPEAPAGRGEMAMLFAYFRGLPPTDWCHIDVHTGAALMCAPCEDDIHLLVLSGPPGLTRGSGTVRQERFDAAVRRFPAVLNPRLLDDAEQLGPLTVVPETMLRGFRRQPIGPGWVLVGDSGLYKHPATGQGIGDALAQGDYVGTELAADRGLEGFAAWRAERTDGHVEFSFAAARFPTETDAALYAGLAADPAAGQEFLDVFPKHHRIETVLTPPRISRYRAAWTYERGVHELLAILEGISEDQWEAPVPACPGWSVFDLVAHLSGVAEDSAAGRFFGEAAEAWRFPETAAGREAWTAGHVARAQGSTPTELVAMVTAHGRAAVLALRQGVCPVAGAPSWGWTAPLGDLSVHLADLREALGLTPDEDGSLTRWGLATFRGWLGQRLDLTGLPGLVLDSGAKQWTVGSSPAAGRVTASPYELFRVVSGRRSARQISALDWTTDPAQYLSVISPYPLPD